MEDLNVNFLVALAGVVFFAAISFLYFTANPYPKRDWARVTVAVSAAVLAIASAVALF